MSIPAFNRCNQRLRLTVAFMVALAVFTFAAGPTLGGTPLISIERTHGTLQGMYEYVSVSYDPNASGQLIAGFDVLMHYDASALSFISATPGSLLTNCGWQYFTYRFGAAGNCPGSTPSGLLRVIALADDPLEPGAQSCFIGDSGPGELAVLKFYVTNDVNYQCQTLPIRFYWCDCGDNALSSVGGDSLLVADTVFWGLDPGEYYPTPAELNSPYGLPDYCLGDSIGSRVPVRAANFREGWVEIVCPDSIDYRGDINLNGVAYEVADRLVFADYFLNGLDVFDPNPAIRAAQIVASDVNADSIPLTFRDIVYMHRVVIGDALPIYRRAPLDTLAATVTQNSYLNIVAVDFTGNLAGAYMEFAGEITPSFNVPAWCPDYCFVHDSGKTRILMMPDEEPQSYPNGIWFTYTGTGNLIHVATTDWFDNEISVTIDHQDTPAICGDSNGDAHLNITDAVYLVRYIFSGGPSPLDLGAGDVNCDGLTSIADIVYVVAYIFSAGPAPCTNCL